MAAGSREVLEKDLGCPEATDELPGQVGSPQRQPRKDGRKGTLSSPRVGGQEVPAVAVQAPLPRCSKPHRRGLGTAETALCGAVKSRGNFGHRGAPARHRPHRDIGHGQGEEEGRLIASSVFLGLIFAQKQRVAQKHDRHLGEKLFREKFTIFVVSLGLGTP